MPIKQPDMASIGRLRNYADHGKILRHADVEISDNYTELSSGPVVMDHHNPIIKVELQGQEIRDASSTPILE